MLPGELELQLTLLQNIYRVKTTRNVRNNTCTHRVNIKTIITRLKAQQMYGKLSCTRAPNAHVNDENDKNVTDTKL